MQLFDRITRYRYQYPNNYSSVKFIDFMITDLNESTAFNIPQELKPICIIIQRIFGYSRYEPTNPYIFHKQVPAARNVHTNEAYLICNGNICRYNCKLNTFECIRFCSEEVGHVRLVVVAELWRIMKFYGEFGLVLPLLDAGHILAQLKLELENIGLTDVDILYGAANSEEYEYLGLSAKSNLITLEVDFKRVASCQIEERIDNSYSRMMNYDAEVSAYEVAEQFLPKNQSFRLRQMICNSILPRPFVNTQQRESAHNHIGISSLQETINEKTAVDYMNQLATCMNHYVEDIERYRVYMLYSTVSGAYLLQIDRGKILEAVPFSVDKSRLLHDSAHMVDMASMPIIMYISYLYDDGLTEKENIYNAHIGAAEISHYFLLNAPEGGFFGRPMRNLEDAYIEELFSSRHNERFLYSVIMGKANSNNYVISLLEMM